MEFYTMCGVTSYTESIIDWLIKKPGLLHHYYETETSSTTVELNR